MFIFQSAYCSTRFNTEKILFVVQYNTVGKQMTRKTKYFSNVTFKRTESTKINFVIRKNSSNRFRQSVLLLLFMFLLPSTAIRLLNLFSWIFLNYIKIFFSKFYYYLSAEKSKKKKNYLLSFTCILNNSKCFKTFFMTFFMMLDRSSPRTQIILRVEGIKISLKL